MILTTLNHVRQDLQERLKRLNILLEKSSVYTSLLGERMNQTSQMYHQSRDNSASTTSQAPNPRRQSGRDASDLSKAQTGSKRARDETHDADGNAKRLKSDDQVSTSLSDQENVPRFKQPEDITGAKLRDYQLVGVEWLTSLWANGVNGILADEMGLGCVTVFASYPAYLANIGLPKIQKSEATPFMACSLY
jgi:ATP-dependent DNA helicase